MKPRCLCQLCSCGRHKCPRKCAHMTDACGQRDISEYRNTYIRFPIEHVQNFKPDVTLTLACEPISADTTNRSDFIRHPIVDERVSKKPDVYHPPEGPFDGCTMYRTEYIRKPICPAKPVLKQTKKFCLPPFDAQTNHKTDFIRWPLNYERAKKKDELYYPPQGPFNGDTMYRTSYIRHEIETREAMKPNVDLKLPCAPLEDRTEHKDQYIRHPLPEKHQRSKDPYVPLQCQLDGLTMYRKDFKRLEIEPVQNYKPEIKSSLACEPLDDKTTHRVDYIRWPLDQPRKQKEKEQYLPPAGQMSCETTHRCEYTRKPLDVVTVKAKPDQRKCILAPLDNCTTYRCEYLRWDSEPPKQHKSDEYFPIAEPFTANTSYRTDFIRLPSATREAMKPGTTTMLSCEPLEDKTEYRNEFTRKEQEPCVAGLIQSGASSGYSFINQDASCHKWYQPQEVAG